MASKRSKVIKTPTSPSPSKRSKKSKLSAPMSCSSSSLPSTSSGCPQASLSSHSAAAETVSDSTSPPQEGYDIPKLLKAVAAFRLRNGISPTMVRCLPDFLNEVRDFVPMGLSEKQLFYKLRHLKGKFRQDLSPGPDCADFDRSFYELGAKAWGPRRLRAKGNASGSVKRNGKADGLKDKRKGADESDWEAEESMESGDDEENELPEDGCINLQDKDEAESPYKFLKHALENFWVAKNLDLNVLQLALQKVDSVQAKRLDEQFMEIAKDELKLMIEKNRLSNDIINAIYTVI